MSIFVRIGTIRGESRDARHKDEIEVLSWTWGVSRAGSPGSGAGGIGGAGRGAGKAEVRDLTFLHEVDRASPLLLRACATGERLGDARLTVRKAGGEQQDFLVITMTDVLVTRVSMSMADGGTSAEEVALTFAKVDLEYRPQQADGSLEAGVRFTHDVKAQRSG